MVDFQFSDPKLASLYDVFCPWEQHGDYDFYLDLVMSAQAVLDVGCGTGALLRRAREDGHVGRLCGLDPAVGMLAQARTRCDIEWILGDLRLTPWHREFDLVVMTGHAFQVLVEDAELRVSLTAIESALTAEGCFAFETRNPLVREWEQWVSANAVEVTDCDAVTVRMAHEVELPVEYDIVRFSTTYTSPSWEASQVNHSTLRFLSAGRLTEFLREAGLEIAQQYGGWQRQPLTDDCVEIITIARRT